MLRRFLQRSSRAQAGDLSHQRLIQNFIFLGLGGLPAMLMLVPLSREQMPGINEIFGTARFFLKPGPVDALRGEPH